MLSRFGSRSPKPPAAVAATPTDALSDAIKSFQNCLEPEQKVQLEAIKAVPDAHAVAQFTHQLDQENAKRKSRCVAARISPLLESIQQFSGIVETFVSSNPHIAALVWGSVKVVLQIASNFTTYFDKLSALLMTVGKRCPRFQEYQKLYRDSTDLQKALCDFFSVVVRCCEQAVTVLRRTGYIQLLKAVTSSFNSDFALIMMKIDQSSQEVKETICLTEAKLHTAERQDQRAEREAAEKYRLSSIMYRKDKDKTEVDRLAQMQLEQRRIRQASKLEQLCDYNHKIAYWKARTQRHGSTGQWLTRTDEFKRWITGSNPSVFWFTGILGSGKTVMTAFVVEQLSAKFNQGTEKLVYFFCQYDNETSLKAVNILRSIVRQLLDQDDRIFTENQSKIDALLDNMHNLSLLESLFSDIINRLTSVVVIIDGIDECSNSEMKLLLKTLRSIMLKQPFGLKLYLAGDDCITDMVMSFLAPRFVVNTHLPEAGSDLQELILQLVTGKREDGDLVAGDPSLYQEIVDVLCNASQGMVLWVKFQLEEICSQKTDESIRNALNHLPKDLSETYSRLLSRTKEEGSAKICGKVFRIMAAVKRPLSPEEVNEAISVEPCQPYFMPERLLNDANGIVRWCHGLIAFDELDEHLQFTHSSVKDFLCGPTSQITLSDFCFRQDEADHQFGEVCVTYLNFNDFKTQVVRYHEPGVLPDPVMMASHALNAGSSRTILNQAKKMMRRRVKLTPASSRLLSQQTNNQNSQMILTKYHLLQYVTEFWLLHTTEFSPDRSRTWNLFQTLAGERYHCISASVVRMSEDLPPDDGLRTFMYTQKHQALFRLYLSRVFNVKHWIRVMASILTFKCYTFIRLLPMFLKLEDQHTRWQELALSGSSSGLIQTIKLSNLAWLEDLTATDRSSILLKVIGTADHLPPPIEIQLIELGVDLYHESENFRKSTTLLEQLIRRSNASMMEKVCDSMIRCGADFNRKIARNGRNALHIAAVIRNPVAVSNLLTHSSSSSLINSTDDYGRTALHLAVLGELEPGRESDLYGTVMTLFKLGASQKIKDANGRVAHEYVSTADWGFLGETFARYRTPLPLPRLRHVGNLNEARI